SKLSEVYPGWLGGTGGRSQSAQDAAGLGATQPGGGTWNRPAGTLESAPCSVSIAWSTGVVLSSGLASTSMSRFDVSQPSTSAVEPGTVAAATSASRRRGSRARSPASRSEEHTSELQSLTNLVCPPL